MHENMWQNNQIIKCSDNSVYGQLVYNLLHSDLQTFYIFLQHAEELDSL